MYIICDKLNEYFLNIIQHRSTLVEVVAKINIITRYEINLLRL